MDTVRYFASLLVIAIATAGLAVGGIGAWTGVVLFLVLALVDSALPRDYRRRNIRYPAMVRALPYLHYPALLAFWMVFGWQLGTGAISGWHIVGGVLSVGVWNGLIGLATAHELMHGKSLLARTGADLIGTCYGIPITDLGHVHVHHIHLDTPLDGDTPKRGESLYRFVLRSVVAQIGATFELEFAYLQKIGKSPWSPRGRLFWGVMFELGFAAGFIWLAGWIGLPILLLTWVLGFTVMADYNYVQHYGLVRVPGATIKPHHAWNHLRPLSRVLAYEITTHSEHHLNPDVTYVSLTPMPDAPQMPSLLVCFMASIVPPLWDRLIARPRLQHWDRHFASADERVLAQQADRAAGWAA